ncbi:MAG: septum formation initiator family protein [Patescibacteria group bacterium]
MWKNNPIKKFLAQRKWQISIGSVIGLIVFSYMFVATAEAMWQNYKINQEIFALKLEITQLEQENIDWKNLIAYLKTESFREKEARRKLGYKKPDETVVALPQDNFAYNNPGSVNNQPVEEQPSKLTNPQKWWDYIFG